MEKYAKLIKGLEVCAGPECCKDGCPYYGETTGGMTCRARLLRDAEIAINNEQALHESAEEALAHRYEDIERLQADADNREAAYKTIRAERDTLRKECEELKEYALALEKEGQEARAKGDKLNQDLTFVIQHREELAADKEALREENKALIEARDALVRKAGDLNSRNEELRKECDMVVMRCQVLQNEINALVLKTDRKSVGIDGRSADWWRGRAEVLEWFIREWFREGGFQS